MIQTYTFIINLDGKRFGGQIPAHSFEEVPKLVPGATDVGLLIETMPVGVICSICAGDMVIAEKPPEPVDEWQESFE